MISLVCFKCYFEELDIYLAALANGDLDYQYCDRVIRRHGHRGGGGGHRVGNDHLAQEALGEMSRHRHRQASKIFNKL